MVKTSEILISCPVPLVRVTEKLRRRKTKLDLKIGRHQPP
jgi:hypothetical protein